MHHASRYPQTLIPSPSPACGRRGHKTTSMEDYTPHHPAKLPEDIRTWARGMRGRMTDAETLLWMLLRNRRIAGAKFRRQHPAGRYILDYYCVEKKLAIELDGGQHVETADYDQHRDNWLRSQGIHVLRFWNNQILTETEAVMEVIYRAIVEEVPLPQAGEGKG